MNMDNKNKLLYESSANTKYMYKKLAVLAIVVVMYIALGFLLIFAEYPSASNAFFILALIFSALGIGYVRYEKSNMKISVYADHLVVNSKIVVAFEDIIDVCIKERPKTEGGIFMGSSADFISVITVQKQYESSVNNIQETLEQIKKAMENSKK